MGMATQAPKIAHGEANVAITSQETRNGLGDLNLRVHQCIHCVRLDGESVVFERLALAVGVRLLRRQRILHGLRGPDRAHPVAWAGAKNLDRPMHRSGDDEVPSPSNLA